MIRSKHGRFKPRYMPLIGGIALGCAMIILSGYATKPAQADAMNALAFSGHNQQRPADDYDEQSLYQLTPSQTQRLRYNAPPPLPERGTQSSHYSHAPQLKPKRLVTERLYKQTSTAPDDIRIDNGHDSVSALENFYSGRILEGLHQFGYDFLQNNMSTAHTPPPLGLVGDAYILGVGDRLSIALTGQRNAHYQIDLDSNGQIHIPGIAPISASGKSLGALKAEISAQFSDEYNQSVYIALSEMRRAAILVAGHVKKPGRVVLSNQHNVIDALMQAGGIDKTGSLRQIRLVRDGQVSMIDLYSLLLHGAENFNSSLKDGDRIIVPPIGPTIAIAGEVKRAGIYEILPVMQGMWHKSKDRAQTLSLNDLLDMSGGLLSPGKTRYLKLDMQNSGDEQMSEIDDPFARVFSDGSILSVSRNKERREGTIEITGHALSSGLHALKSNRTLTALIKDERNLGRDVYPLIAVIERWNKKTLAPEYISFSPLMVLSRKFDAPLQDGDVLHFFSYAQIQMLDPYEEETPFPHKTKQKPLLQNIAYGDVDNENLADIEQIPEDIRAILQERSAFIRGAVRRSGHYPVSEGASLANIISVAGGLTLEADKKNIEITRREDSIRRPEFEELRKTKRRNVNIQQQQAENITITSGDTIRINQKFKKISDNHVQIIGEVKNPGRYDLMAGDTVLSLITRAGGLNKYAYAEGAILSRKSERHIEAQRYKSYARNLELALANKMQSDSPPNDNQIAMTRQLIEQLSNTDTIGRITFESDPDILATHPELNMLLERGDRIYIPKRPLTVRVSGEVLSPSSLQFRSEKKAREYIYEAGGYTRNADKDRVFVVYPDGSAQPLHLGNWTHSVPFIPPGSSIIVPHDPKPFSFLDSAKDITQIFTNLAVTGFLVSEIQDD